MRAGRRGMNIIEVMLSLAILSMLMMAILSLLPTARVAVKRAQIRICADAEAQSQLELLRTQPLDTLSSRDLGPVTHEGLPEFRRSLVVVPGSQPRAPELRVTISWEWSGQPMSVSHALVICHLPR